MAKLAATYRKIKEMCYLEAPLSGYHPCILWRNIGLNTNIIRILRFNISTFCYFFPFRHDWWIRLFLPGLLFLHCRHFWHRKPDKEIVTDRRSLPLGLLHRQCICRLHQEEPRLHVQLQLGHALCHACYGIHLPLC